MNKEIKNNTKKFYIYKIIVVAIFTALIVFILNKAPNYIRNDITDKTNLVINNNNITRNLKNDVIVEDGVVYISTKDIANFFDDSIFYDNKYNQIITTSETKVATMKIDEKQVEVNGTKQDLMASAKKINENFYLPFSEISNSVYNVETTYVDTTDTVVLVSLDRELTYANSSKNNNVKYKPDIFSRNVDKVNSGDTLTVVNTEEELPSGWSKVTTENGKVGYVKTNTLANLDQIRSTLNLEKQIDGNVSMVWDYFSQYVTAPQREGEIKGVNVVSPTFFALQKLGKGNIVANVGEEGEEYIDWAHSNGYKVWALVSNDSMKETTSEILNDYELRKQFINNILTVVEIYNLDGINLDFENIYEADKNMYTRLVVELAPRLREMGKVLSVDVTAPDGSPDWSLCYDRNEIANAADYIIFMGYDQNGISSPKEGTTAGCDWVKANINKFLGQEGVDSSKLILGVPFYTRVWIEKDGELDSKVWDMEDIYENIPEGTNIEWDDSLKQNYAEYEQDGATYKVWIEDDDSIKAKLELVNEYNLAGAAYWEKDREPDEIWNTISEVLSIE